MLFDEFFHAIIPKERYLMKRTCLFALTAVMFFLTTAYILPYDYMDENPYVAAVPALHQPPPYDAGAVIIMCADTGMVLYGHEYHTPMYPASITKIMTALVVLDHVQDLSERIEFSYHSIFSIPRNSSHISMDVGETLTVNQALNALMIRSANEVAIALAEHVAGTEEDFVQLMNARAQTLGAYNTYFTNPTGLPGVGHVTTAYDMALIKREAVRLFPIYTNIISTPQFAIPPTERQPEVRELLSTNRLIQPGPFFNEHVIGGKTGWTNAAQHTLVTYAEYEGRRIIVTVLQAESPGTFVDTTNLLNYAFSLPFDEVTVFDANYTLTIPVMQNIDGTITEIGRTQIQAERGLTFHMPSQFDTAWIRKELGVPATLEAPVNEGEVAGRVAVYVRNLRIGEVPLIVQNTIPLYDPTALYEGGGTAQGVAGSSQGIAGSSGTGASPDENSTSPYLDPYMTQLYDYIYNQPTSLFGLTLHLSEAQEFLLTLIVPIILSAATLFAAFIIYITRRRRRTRKILHARYARYPHYYKYR